MAGIALKSSMYRTRKVIKQMMNNEQRMVWVRAACQRVALSNAVIPNLYILEKPLQ